MNASNGSLPCGSSVDSREEEIAKIVAYSIILVLGLLGNILTITVVCREKSLHNTVNYLMVNMAVSDLMIPLVTLPHYISNLVESKPFEMWSISGHLGTATCKLYFFLTDISSSVSILSLVVITVDRFCAIMFPFRTGLAPFNRVNRISIALTWIIPALFWTPNLYSYKLIFANNAFFCFSHFTDDPVKQFQIKKIQSTVIIVFFLIVPFIVLAIMYTLILLRLRQQDRSAMALSQSKRDRILRFKKTRRVVFMALTVLLVFFLCWMPLNALVFLFYHIWDPSELPTMCFIRVWAFVAQYLGYANPVFNPVIYFIFIEKFRRGLINCLTCHNRNRLQQTMLNSDGRENAGRSAMAIFEGGSPRTRASSGISLQFQTHRL